MPLLGDSGGNEDDVDGQMAALISDLTGIEAFSNLKPLVWAEELDETVAELPVTRVLSTRVVLREAAPGFIGMFNRALLNNVTALTHFYSL
ncbi:hypothetical protein OUZ56_007568 [Daphnia magna]|uniref:Uncharacterized protein n=1 Tax=Daphnia magna TaxID=35525 RepID=A0ABR0AAB9_9CRUS|nr:hypothetical protein OUZ56_007568 [Daphnia magna]